MKEDLQTIEDYQKFIDSHGMETKKEFRNYNNGYYYNKFISKFKMDDLKFKRELHHLFKDEFSTIEDFQKFIDSNNIEKPTIFRKVYPKIYDRLCRVLSVDDKKRLIYKNKLNSYSEITTEADLQQFIDKQNLVINRKSLHKYFPGLYVKFQKSLDKIIFKNNNISLGENFIKELLINNNIKFEMQKVFDDLRVILPLRYDFYLPEYNLIIEHHGEGHFGKGRYYTKELIDNDKLKYKYALDNNINILYYTIYKNDYKTLGYFTNVITDPEVLISEIKKISPTN